MQRTNKDLCFFTKHNGKVYANSEVNNFLDSTPLDIININNQVNEINAHESYWGGNYPQHLIGKPQGTYYIRPASAITSPRALTCEFIKSKENEPFLIKKLAIDIEFNEKGQLSFYYYTDKNIKVSLPSYNELLDNLKEEGFHYLSYKEINPSLQRTPYDINIVIKNDYDEQLNSGSSFKI